MTASPDISGNILKGIPVSPGITLGKAHLVDRSKVKILYQYLIDENQLNAEIERFQNAVAVTEEQLETLKGRMPEEVKQHAFILDSHLMILKDSMLCESTARKIKEEKINAEWALKKSFHEIEKIFSRIDDEYISSRIQDVESVTERILRNLSGDTQESLAEIKERVIIVAHDLSPADTSELNVSKVMGFITDVGGRTSHTAIMAQSLEIPAIVGLESATLTIAEGDLLIVDGNTGDVIINPDDSGIIYYQEKQLQHEKYKSSIARTSHLPAETPDGYRMTIKANIEFLEEVAAVRNHGAEGIGLYRTEFLYLRSGVLPSGQELFDDYREVVELMAPEPVTLRTLDLGGDKFASGIEIANEVNPALGLRAIRLFLKKKELFKTQLRAILRTSIYGNVRLMFPMISGLQEVLDATEVLNDVKRELEKEEILYDENMLVGIMIEIPSAVVISDLLAQHVDFFSIGTNDLIQFALAIDRVNEHVAFMYQPFHPAILRMIRQVVQEARKAGIQVSLCGEMAGDPLCIPILLALGLDELSMNARAIPMIKNIIRSISLEEARRDFDRVIRLNTAREVRAYLLKRMKKLIPELDEKGYLRS
ncbi:MAG: phosphoenolpyruvate--protein phosphotransferase [Desulfatiglandaceae bacterium]|jgi:phosphoenolpyruvate-protein phosphotransferase (PTS system enzyme I)